MISDHDIIIWYHIMISYYDIILWYDIMIYHILISYHDISYHDIISCYIISQHDISCLNITYHVLRCYKMSRKSTKCKKMQKNYEQYWKMVLIGSNPIILGLFYTKILWEFIFNDSKRLKVWFYSDFWRFLTKMSKIDVDYTDRRGILWLDQP